MLQQEGPPEDFVIATGRQESVRKFIELSAQELGWGSIQWTGKGVEETGKRADTGEVVVRIDPRYSVPQKWKPCLEIPRKQKKIKWIPSTTLEELVAEMINADKEEAQKEAILRRKVSLSLAQWRIHQLILRQSKPTTDNHEQLD